MVVLDHEAVIGAAVSRWGADAARGAAPGDVVGGVPARVLLEPFDEAMLSEMLAWANEARLALVPRGSGTRLPRSRPPARVDALLSLRRLSSPVEHRPGDLVATIPAGATIDAANTVLRREGQWLPLDLPSPKSTAGGFVAANDSGPRRAQHGSPRDLILGARMVLADGRRIASGGQVVKNVTGYDLARLLCGSEGRLAVLTAATFKLAPVAPASRTVVAAARHPDDLGPMAAAIADAPLAPSAVELEAPAGRLLVRFETTERAAAVQAEQAATLLSALGGITDICDGGTEEEVWRDHESLVWAHEGTVLRASVLPARVGPFLSRLRALAAASEVEHAVAGRATLGALLVRWEVPQSKAGRTLETIRREANAAGGTATVMSFPQPLSIRTDLWDDAGGGMRVLQAVKARLDPNGILSPGRGPGGS